jgi:hypothetical protein
MSMKAVLDGHDDLRLPLGTLVAPEAVAVLAAAERMSAEDAEDGHPDIRRHGGKVRILTYAGAKINKTIALVLAHSGLSIISASNIALAFETESSDEETWDLLASIDEDRVLRALVEIDLSSLQVSSKFLNLLTDTTRRETILAAATDVEGALKVLRSLSRSQERR